MRFTESLERIRGAFPGLLLALVIASAASFIVGAYGGPVILIALFLGMTFHFLSEEPRFSAGLALASQSVLRIGVALLGARITIEQIAALGWVTLALVAASVCLTIGFGMLVARLIGLKTPFGVLTGGAVAICGASAAAAISAALPKHENHESDTAFTIIGITSLSTIAMVLYPLLASGLGLSAHQTGIFLGGAIHDVAQVVGAGYSVSQETGDVATIVKLLRVSLLLPVVLVISVLARRTMPRETTRKPPLVPGFLIAFMIIVGLNSLHLLSPLVQNGLTTGSRWCIVIAIAGLGVRTSFAHLANVGGRAIGLMVAETLFIATLMLGLIAVQQG